MKNTQTPDPDPSPRQLEMWTRVAREESHDRLVITRIQIGSALLLILSTLMVWEKHPRVTFHLGRHPGYYISDVHHSIGATTRPAGLIAIALGLLILVVAPRLRKVHPLSGLAALLLAFATLATSIAEIIQLLLGRRNWLDDLAHSVTHGPGTLADAAGRGVWIAALASVVLVVSAACYVWLAHYTWRNARVVPE